jgi:DNA polymerase (family 10)
MRIINNQTCGDYHLHTSTFSDGLNSLDEMVIQAGKIGLGEIAITDHSQAYLDSYGIPMRTHYRIFSDGRWQNIHNRVNVMPGIEADLINEQGDACFQIQGISPGFVILSTHPGVYQGDPKRLKNAYLNAIRRHGSRVTLLGHLCSRSFSSGLSTDDITAIVRAAAAAGIAVELNCAHLVGNQTCRARLAAMLAACDALYVNSDAHTLHELINLRQQGFRYLGSLKG